MKVGATKQVKAVIKDLRHYLTMHERVSVSRYCQYRSKIGEPLTQQELRILVGLRQSQTSLVVTYQQENNMVETVFIRKEVLRHVR